MSRPTERRFSTWQSGAPTTTWLSTPRKPRSSLWTSGGPKVAHTICINEMKVERVASFKFLGVHISEDLSWTLNTSTLVKKAHQRLFFLRRLKAAHLSPQILVNFYRCTIESILTNCISVWFGSCSVADRQTLQRVVKTAQRITGSPLPTIDAVQRKRCLRKARSIEKD